MKKVMFSLPLMVGLLFGAQNQKVEDCVETFQKEVAEILYSNPEDKNASIEMLTKKIKVMFDDVTVGKRKLFDCVILLRCQ